MALLTLPKSPARRGKHAAKTPFWRQVGIGRGRHDLTAARLVSPPPPEPAAAKTPAPVPVVTAALAREVVERLFPAGTDGLYPLDWKYGPGRASAQVDPGLIPDAARNVVLSYASTLDAPFTQNETGTGRLHMRVSRVVDGVQVTVRADITPDPKPQLALPAAAEPVLPIEEGVRRCVLDETQRFPAITDDMPDPREHPDTGPDGDRPAPPPTKQEHPSTPDAAHAEPADEDDDTPENTASTDDTSSTPLPQGDEDHEEEEVAVHG